MNYLFRGKRIDNGEWVEGDLTRSLNGKTFIHHPKPLSGGRGVMGSTEVHPKSIGMWTGLTDKNGQKIFGALPDSKGGDITHSPDWNPNKYTVVFFEGEFALDDGSLEYLVPIHYAETEFEVVGNAFDNPELLEDA